MIFKKNNHSQVHMNEFKKNVYDLINNKLTRFKLSSHYNLRWHERRFFFKQIKKIKADNQVEHLEFHLLHHKHILLRPEHLELIYKALKYTPKLKYLSIYGNDAGSKHGPYIVESIISETKSLLELHLGENGFKPEGVNIIINAIAKHPKIKVLDIRKNVMSGKNLNDLLNLLTNHPTLTQVTLSNFHGYSYEKLVLEYLKEYSNLKLFNFYGRPVHVRNLQNTDYASPFYIYDMNKIHNDHTNIFWTSKVSQHFLLFNNQSEALTRSGNHDFGYLGEDGFMYNKLIR